MNCERQPATKSEMSDSSDSEFETDFLDKALKKTTTTIAKSIAAKTYLCTNEATDKINKGSDDEGSWSISATKKARVTLDDSLNDSIVLGECSVEEAREAVPTEEQENVTPPASPVSAPLRGRARGRGRRRGRGRGSRGPANQDVRTKETEAALRLLKSKKLAEERRKQKDIDEDDDADLDDSVIDLVGKQFSLKLQWMYQVHRLDVEEENDLRSVVARISELIGVDAAELELFVGGELLDRRLTVGGCGLGIASIVDVRKRSVVTQDEIELKFQSKDTTRKTSAVTLRTLPTAKFSALMEQYIATTGLTAAKITFTLDGDALDPDETPFDHDLEGGECIDVVY